MFFPESLYLLSQRDQQVTWLEPVIQRSTSTSAAVSISHAFAVPEGRALLLQHAHVRAIGGAAQLNTVRSLYLDRPGAPEVYLDRSLTAGPVAGEAFLEWQGSVLLPAGWRVTTSSTFDAAANPNSLYTSLAGLMIPIGNIARL